MCHGSDRRRSAALAFWLGALTSGWLLLAFPALGVKLLTGGLPLDQMKEAVQEGGSFQLGALLARFVLDPLRARWGYDTDIPTT